VCVCVGGWVGEVGGGVWRTYLYKENKPYLYVWTGAARFTRARAHTHTHTHTHTHHTYR
jgi:hypothetical protein